MPGMHASFPDGRIGRGIAPPSRASPAWPGECRLSITIAKSSRRCRVSKMAVAMQLGQRSRRRSWCLRGQGQRQRAKPFSPRQGRQRIAPRCGAGNGATSSLATSAHNVVCEPTQFQRRGRRRGLPRTRQHDTVAPFLNRNGWKGGSGCRPGIDHPMLGAASVLAEPEAGAFPLTALLYRQFGPRRNGSVPSDRLCVTLADAARAGRFRVRTQPST